VGVVVVVFYSGFHDRTKDDFQAFTKGLTSEDSIVLLLQGGNGYEKYLGNYYDPIERNCKSKIIVIAPDNGKRYIDDQKIEIIKSASAVFIGGGDTELYRELYCTTKVADAIKALYSNGKTIAGLSAGSIILNDEVYEKATGKMNRGIGLVNNTFVFPHFEEESYAYEMITFLRNNPGKTAYGLENNSYLAFDTENGMQINGNGKVYKGKYIDKEIRIRILS
jgi:cyanophycinase-like exopeptidase